ncbi:MAG: class I SAM-dependent methyltransferase [archaeon]
MGAAIDFVEKDIGSLVDRYGHPVLQYAEGQSGLDVLDVGCNDSVGIPFIFGKHQGRNNVTQIDSEDSAIQILKHKYAALGWDISAVLHGSYPTHATQNGNKFDLMVFSAVGKLTYGFFDVIFSSEDLIKSTKRLLKPNGKLLVADAGMGTPSKYFDPDICRNEEVMEANRRLRGIMQAGLYPNLDLPIDYEGNCATVGRMKSSGFRLDTLLGPWAVVIKKSY